MNKNSLKALIAFVVFAGGIAAFLYWQQMPSEVAVKAPPPVLPQVAKPEVSQVIETPSGQAALPPLAESDSLVLDALAGLIANPALRQLFHTEQVIRNIVATVDNLTQRKLPLRLMPLKQPAGKFIAAGKAGGLTISPQNAARYTPYVTLAEAIDTQKLVELYVRLYPLFQQAYAELGYPNRYFNDRLLEVIDDLLDAPDIKEPISLVRPEMYYQFSDAEIEELPIGQRILIRTGSKNKAVLSAKLRDIKQELQLHMRDKKIGSAE